ncbi:MAG TPA: DUF1326 domain-containing protein [Thermoanaerobaculia bacterium]|nr:DUF1326 domain-containing protein [Thermoanaerobaculia bacterium]
MRALYRESTPAGSGRGAGRRWLGGASLLLVLVPAAAASAGAATISGDYLEARTADVYTGPCFANSEVNLAGKEAILAWRVERGSWQGVAVDGLSVLAAVRASATLGDPFADPLPARSLIVVDERATAAQREALIGFAHSMAGDLLGSVVETLQAPIELALGRSAPVAAAAGRWSAGAGEHSGHALDSSSPASPASQSLSGQASLRAGDLVALRTRGLDHDDHLCGNEEIYYPPLAPASGAVPAATLVYDFRGPGLGMTWSSPGKRNAFVGHFEL